MKHLETARSISSSCSATLLKLVYIFFYILSDRLERSFFETRLNLSITGNHEAVNISTFGNDVTCYASQTRTRCKYRYCWTPLQDSKDKQKPTSNHLQPRAQPGFIIDPDPQLLDEAIQSPITLTMSRTGGLLLRSFKIAPKTFCISCHVTGLD